MKKPHHISLSIAVVCYKSSEEELHELLSSILIAVEILAGQFDLDPLPIYLIDNSESKHLSLQSFADLQSRIHELGVELKLLAGHGNLGYGSGHNRVISRRGKMGDDYHLILNPDIVLDPQFLLSGITLLESDKKLVVLSPNTTGGNGEKQYLCKRYPAVFTLLIRGFFPSILKSLFTKRMSRYEMHGLDEEQPCLDIPIVSGACMFCRSAALHEAGGFDEFYFLYFEDFDLSLRLAKHGKIAYLPTMKISHGGGMAASKGGDHIRMFIRSGVRFFNSHGWRWFKQ